jgi:hypothetical protein
MIAIKAAMDTSHHLAARISGVLLTGAVISAELE